MGKEIQSKIYQNKSRRWLKDWNFRGEDYVAPGTLFKELVAEDPAGFKNAMRMDLEKFNELIPCWTQLFSRKGLLCHITLSDGGSIAKVGGPKPMTRFFSPTTRAGSSVAKNFKRGHNFHIFFSAFFSTKLI